MTDERKMKRKLRELKKLEQTLRKGQKLIWEDFFSLGKNGRGKFTLDQLIKMTRQERKKVFEEYLRQICTDKFNNLSTNSAIISQLLAEINLPSDADELTIKQRYRELIKRYHPDKGGNQEKAMRLLEVYQKLKKRD